MPKCVWSDECLYNVSVTELTDDDKSSELLAIYSSCRL